MEPIILNPNSDASTCMQQSANNPPNTVSQLKKLFLKTNISIGNTNVNNMQQLQINSESITLKPRQTYTNRNISELQNMRPMSPSSVKAQQTKQMQPMANFDSYSSDEFESAFKIKENIQLSLKNLKPTLAGLDVLRSSASDDDDWSSQPPQSDQSNRPDNNNPEAKKSQSLVYNSNNNSTNCMKMNLKPSMSLVNANGTTPTSTLKLQVTNSLAKPNYVRAPNRSTYYLPASTTTTPAILTPIYNSAMASLKKQAQSKVSNKRGKEEALSNSSSSDEDDHYQQSQKTALVNHQNKLQQLLLNNNNSNNGTLPNTSQLSTLKLPITTNSMNFNNNLRQQSYNITPVMSSVQAQASLQQQQQAQPTITATSSSSNSSKPIANESDGLSGLMSNTSKSCKTDHEYDNKQNSSLNSQSSPALSSSSASSIASFSPINSVTSPCTANETFDILDDSSSTASGPIYVRQPGKLTTRLATIKLIVRRFTPLTSPLYLKLEISNQFECV
jgi:hypothetical protein